MSMCAAGWIVRYIYLTAPAHERVGRLLDYVRHVENCAECAAYFKALDAAATVVPHEAEADN